MALTAGTRLGRYEIRTQIGAGGMGEVYLAQDMQLGRTVAVKILPAELASDQERMRRFVQEAKTTSALNHPNIIRGQWLRNKLHFHLGPDPGLMKHHLPY